MELAGSRSERAWGREGVGVEGRRMNAWTAAWTRWRRLGWWRDRVERSERICWWLELGFWRWRFRVSRMEVRVESEVQGLVMREMTAPEDLGERVWSRSTAARRRSSIGSGGHRCGGKVVNFFYNFQFGPTVL